MKRLAPALVLAGSLSSPAVAAADLELPAIFADGMVLQRDAEVPLWGRAAPGESVAVHASWRDAPQRTTADASGAWRVALPTPAAGGPHRIVVEGTERVVLDDVLVGEVWLASGQSNMEMPVRQTFDARRELSSAELPSIRLFTVPNVPALEPAADCAGARWAACSPETAQRFSATAFFFGRALHRELDVPIGLIAADWSATPARAWTSEEGLRAAADDPLVAADLAALDELRSPSPRHQAAQRRRARDWWARDPGTTGEWMSADLDDADWKETTLPAPWQGELADFDGIVWYRRSIELPVDWAARELELSLGPIDDMDAAWVNGRRVGGLEGRHRWNVSRVYTVPASATRPGRNVIAVRVLDTFGYGGFLGGPEQLSLGPRGAIAPRSLAGTWRYAVGASLEGAPPFPYPDELDAMSPTALFNGMIHPLAGYGIRGAIWYQGESDRDRAATYRSLFPALIRDWRARWGRGDFPFYFVQIAPFAYPDDRGQTGELREAQRLALEVPNTGMVVTTDVGDPLDIHPRDKRAVGERLARWALARTYGRELAYSGPLYRSMEVEGGAIRVRFDHATGGLIARDAAPTHFHVAGADRRFVAADTRVEGDALVVSSPEVPQPVAVRYAQGPADEPNLFNAAGLPAAPFRTDDWPWTTQRE